MKKNCVGMITMIVVFLSLAGCGRLPKQVKQPTDPVTEAVLEAEVGPMPAKDPEPQEPAPKRLMEERESRVKKEETRRAVEDRAQELREAQVWASRQVAQEPQDRQKQQRWELREARWADAQRAGRFAEAILAQHFAPDDNQRKWFWEKLRSESRNDGNVPGPGDASVMQKLVENLPSDDNDAAEAIEAARKKLTSPEVMNGRRPVSPTSSLQDALDWSAARVRLQAAMVKTNDGWEHRSPVHGAVKISPDGKKIATADRYCHASGVWDLETGKKLATIPGLNPLGATHIAWSPDSHKLATTVGGGVIQVYDLATGKMTRAMAHKKLFLIVNALIWKNRVLAISTPAAAWMTFDSKDLRVIASGRVPGWTSARVVDAADDGKKVVYDFSFPQLIGPETDINTLKEPETNALMWLFHSPTNTELRRDANDACTLQRNGKQLGSFSLQNTGLGNAVCFSNCGAFVGVAEPGYGVSVYTLKGERIFSRQSKSGWNSIDVHVRKDGTMIVVAGLSSGFKVWTVPAVRTK